MNKTDKDDTSDNVDDTDTNQTKEYDTLIKKNDEIQKEIIKIYPFINDLVDTFYKEHLNTFIDKSIESEGDKSVFLMFVMMYFCIHLKLEKENNDVKKDNIKILMSDIINDPEKRRLCLELFESKFHNLFLQSSKEKRLVKNK
jgi:hypothetical protein